MIFELNNINFSYLNKFPALCDVSVSIEEGQKVVLMGANGTGKSTLLSLLDALIFAGSGSFRAFDREVMKSDFQDEGFSLDFRRKVGFVFQNPDIQLFCPTVKEDILFGPLQLGVDEGQAKRRLERLAAILKLEHLLDRSVHQLSLGEKKKAANAGVLAIEPQVLLLDEPTAGLDPRTTRDIIDLLLAESQKGKTIITATHDLHLCSEIADVIHVFGSGNTLVRSLSSSEIFSDEAFLKENNLIHIHRHSHGGSLHTHPHIHLDHHA
ncbi:MAG TPA: ABC transporter ATP-binding protein [Candidatus Omnitrophota bacterium]|nr:ABC transporter ATP-binding protein [Candidatus Omnitrophota bacterium]